MNKCATHVIFSLLLTREVNFWGILSLISCPPCLSFSCSQFLLLFLLLILLLLLISLLFRRWSYPPNPPYTHQQQSPTGATLAHWLPRIAEDGRELQHAPRSLREHFDTVRWVSMLRVRCGGGGVGSILLYLILHFSFLFLTSLVRLYFCYCTLCSYILFSFFTCISTFILLLFYSNFNSMAVRQDWRALEYASSELKGDGEIVLTAIMQVIAKSRTETGEEQRGDREEILKQASKQTNRETPHNIAA